MSRPEKPENSEASTANTGKCALDTKIAHEVEKDALDSEKIDRPAELGGQKGPEPTRYGDWEKNGRCTDF